MIRCPILPLPPFMDDRSNTDIVRYNDDANGFELAIFNCNNPAFNSLSILFSCLPRDIHSLTNRPNPPNPTTLDAITPTNDAGSNKTDSDKVGYAKDDRANKPYRLIRNGSDWFKVS